MKSPIQSTPSSSQFLILCLLTQFALVVHSEFQPVPGYPDCFVQNPSLIGNNKCDNRIPYNSEECSYDGLDCSDFNSQYPNCQVVNTNFIGDGTCHNIYPFNTSECKFDGGDCDDFRKQYPNCHVMESAFVGNGECQDFAPYNSSECGYDGGDCLIKEEKDFSDRYIGIGIGSILGFILVFVMGCHCAKLRLKRSNADPSVPSKSFTRHHSSHGNLQTLDMHEKPSTLSNAKNEREISGNAGDANVKNDEGSRGLDVLRMSSSNDNNDDVDIEAVGAPKSNVEPATSGSLSSDVVDDLRVSSSSSSSSQENE